MFTVYCYHIFKRPMLHLESGAPRVIIRFPGGGGDGPRPMCSVCPGPGEVTRWPPAAPWTVELPTNIREVS